jgi:hypothetical protein
MVWWRPGLFQHLVCFFLPSADPSFMPVSACRQARTGFFGFTFDKPWKEKGGKTMNLSEGISLRPRQEWQTISKPSPKGECSEGSRVFLKSFSVEAKRMGPERFWTGKDLRNLDTTQDKSPSQGSAPRSKTKFVLNAVDRS